MQLQLQPPPPPQSILKSRINPNPPMQDKKVRFAGRNVNATDPNQPSKLTSMNPYCFIRMGSRAQRKYHEMYKSGGTIHSDSYAQERQDSIFFRRMHAVEYLENNIGITQPTTARLTTDMQSKPAHYFVVNECQVNPLPPLPINIAFSYQGKEEVLVIPVLADLSDLGETEKQRKIYYHLETVTGIILSSTPAESYVLHGSRALAVNLIDQTSADIIKKAENELQINEKFHIPLSEDQACDIDLATIHTMSGIKNIEQIFRQSLASNSSYCQFTITPDATFEQYVSLLSSPRHSAQIRVVTGHAESLKLLHQGKPIFNLDITYAPEDPIDPNLPCHRPFKKDSHSTKVNLGNRNFNLQTSTLNQSIYDSGR